MALSQPQLLVGKVAAITGGLTGIGRAIALEYLQQGAYVVVNHLGEGTREHELVKSFHSDAAEIAGTKSQNFITLPGDVSQPETGRRFIAEAVKTFGRLDIFVSNAGVCQFAEFLELSPDLLEKTVSINLSGAFYVTQAAARQMALHQSPPGGSIIGISSISALVGGGQQTHYTPTKAGVLSLMQSCAVALGKHNIRCNAILPGTIHTQLNDADLSDENKRKYMEGRIPLGRLGQPKDIAGPAVFLASDWLSGYVVCPLPFFALTANINEHFRGVFVEKPKKGRVLTGHVKSGAQLLVDGGLFVNLQ